MKEYKFKCKVKQSEYNSLVKEFKQKGTSPSLSLKTKQFWENHKADKAFRDLERLSGYSYGDYHLNRDKSKLEDKCIDLMAKGMYGELSHAIDTFISGLSKDKEWKNKE